MTMLWGFDEFIEKLRVKGSVTNADCKRLGAKAREADALLASLSVGACIS